uniref:CopG family transcriptional regulator n=1 Tax=uncultured Thiotrichaceae bacterium TaxID=298394 RepID=A0A6S6UJI6_9GAMM|nr:MAG: CopG family transcriptional regulator [uncultured Thiotrichaceae bacterium]
MRATIQLDDHLHDLARKHAVAKGKTFTALVEEALREKLLFKGKSSVEKKHVTLKTVSGRGVQSGVDLDSNAAVLNLMD